MTGELERPVVWGSTKATTVQQFAARHGVDLRRSYFYADGDEDIGLGSQSVHAGKVVGPAQVEVSAAFAEIHAKMLGGGIGIIRGGDAHDVRAIFAQGARAAWPRQNMGEIEYANALQRIRRARSRSKGHGGAIGDLLDFHHRRGGEDAPLRMLEPFLLAECPGDRQAGLAQGRFQCFRVPLGDFPLERSLVVPAIEEIEIAVEQFELGRACHQIHISAIPALKQAIYGDLLGINRNPFSLLQYVMFRMQVMQGVLDIDGDVRIAAAAGMPDRSSGHTYQ